MYFHREGKTQFEIRDRRNRSKIRACIGSFLNKKEKLTPSADYDVVITTEDGQIPAGFEKIKKEPFLVNSPGEYEISGLLIYSFRENDSLIHILQTNQQKTVYISALEGDELKSQQVERIGEVDVLLVALGGDKMTPEKAVNLISDIEPKLVIPLNYKKKELKEFLKSLGADEKRVESNFTLKKKDLNSEGVAVKVVEQ